jgi:hypothetical protein
MIPRGGMPWVRKECEQPTVIAPDCNGACGVACCWRVYVPQNVAARESLRELADPTEQGSAPASGT